MKHSFFAILAIAGLLFAQNVNAQQETDTTAAKKRHHQVTVSNRGIKIQRTDDDSVKTQVGVLDSTTHEHKSKFTISVGPVDVGFNVLADNTNYSDPRVQSYLHVPAAEQNKSLFDLRTGKSVNVNVYPVMFSYRALKTRNQRIFISSGIGLQLYNFRYESPLTYTKNPSGVMMDTISFKKDKLALDYLHIPLMFTFKTRMHSNTWLVYGVGITEGYLIDSWTKQESGLRGKVKDHDSFGLASFNTCISAEFGIDDNIRFFATYQLTSLYNNGLDQHPFSFGIRFGGI